MPLDLLASITAVILACGITVIFVHKWKRKRQQFNYDLLDEEVMLAEEAEQQCSEPIHHTSNIGRLSPYIPEDEITLRLREEGMRPIKSWPVERNTPLK